MTSSEMNELVQQAQSGAGVSPAASPAGALGGASLSLPMSASDKLGSSPADARDRLVGSPYPPLFGRVAHRVAQVHVRSWDAALRRLRRVQESTLLSIVRASRGTEFGRKFAFDGVD